MVLGVIGEGLIALLHIAPPGATFSSTLNSAYTTRLRDANHPGGISGLSTEQSARVKQGNCLAEIAAILFKAQHKQGGQAQLQQPKGSLMRIFEPIAAVVSQTSAQWYVRDSGVDGEHLREPLALAITLSAIGEAVEASCPAWACAIAEAWMVFLLVYDTSRPGKAPMLTAATAACTKHQIVASGAVLPARRTAERLAQVLAGGGQPPRTGLPTLVPDGLTPERHLQTALRVGHPMTAAAAPTDAVGHALQYSIDDPIDAETRRGLMRGALEELEHATIAENEFVLSKVHADVAKVLRAGSRPKQLCFMREVQYCIQAPDSDLAIGMVLGLPMLGWTPPAVGNMQRDTIPAMSIEEWGRDRIERNTRILARLGPSGDDELDDRAWKKSLAEHKLGEIEDPFMAMDDTPSRAPHWHPGRASGRCTSARWSIQCGSSITYS